MSKEQVKNLNGVVRAFMRAQVPGALGLGEVDALLLAKYTKLDEYDNNLIVYDHEALGIPSIELFESWAALKENTLVEKEPRLAPVAGSRAIDATLVRLGHLTVPTDMHVSKASKANSAIEAVDMLYEDYGIIVHKSMLGDFKAPVDKMLKLVHVIAPTLEKAELRKVIAALNNYLLSE